VLLPDLFQLFLVKLQDFQHKTLVSWNRKWLGRTRW
jgi:hypothetical protein